MDAIGFRVRHVVPIIYGSQTDMKELLSIVLDYVDDRQANYAFMITGPSGSGNTYSWMNIIAPKIQADQGKENPARVTYVSLYGLSKLDDGDSVCP